MTDTLPGDWPEPPPPATVNPATLSADRRRTIHQQQHVSNGVHPLTLGPLHPQASRQRTRQSSPRDPYTCGTCSHRVLNRAAAQPYPKCDEPSTPWTGGPGTDVRAWWPACTQYQPTIPLPTT